MTDYELDFKEDSSEDSFENEKWEDIDGYNGQYQISDQGRVRSPNGILRISFPTLNGAGYIGLRGKTQRVDRLVLETFTGPAPGPTYGPLHRDGDHHNCRLDNLEWQPGMSRHSPTVRKLKAKKKKAHKAAEVTKSSSPQVVLERRFFVLGAVEVIANPQEGWIDLAQNNGQAKFAHADIPGLIEVLQYYLDTTAHSTPR